MQVHKCVKDLFMYTAFRKSVDLQKEVKISKKKYILNIIFFQLFSDLACVIKTGITNQKRFFSDISSTLQLLELTFQENSFDHLFLKGAFDNFDFSVLSKATILKNQAR